MARATGETLRGGEHSSGQEVLQDEERSFRATELADRHGC